jgi:hypothetical protein
VRIEVRPDRDRYAPGETVRGAVAVVAGGGPALLVVALNLHERSTGCEAIAIATPPTPIHEGELIEGSVYRFGLGLPADAPPSVASPHGGLWWAVDVSAGEPGSSPLASRRIEVEAPPPAVRLPEPPAM